MEKTSEAEPNSRLLVSFDIIDQVTPADIRTLLSDLRAAGVQGQIEQYHSQKGMLLGAEIIALLAVSTASLAATAAIVAFMYSVFRLGVVLDLRGDSPRIYKNNELPRGSVLVLPKKGQQQFHDGLTAAQAAVLIKGQLSKLRRS